MIKIEVGPGEEIIKKITKVIKEKRISSGNITLLGAVDSCTISSMDKTDPKNDLLEEFNEPFEISGTGEIENSTVHIHVVLGKENKTALFGHLHKGLVTTWFVHAYITQLEA
jgi:predicted DNA-binding protein with PD1-like motif